MTLVYGTVPVPPLFAMLPRIPARLLARLFCSLVASLMICCGYGIALHIPLVHERFSISINVHTYNKSSKIAYESKLIKFHFKTFMHEYQNSEVLFHVRATEYTEMSS